MKLPTELQLLSMFGRQRFTGQDFMALIHACGIELVLSAEVENGHYYYSHERQHVIVISAKLPAWHRAQIGWHEFAHFLQNFRNPVPMQANYCDPKNRTERERFADGFSFVCITGVSLCGRMDFLKSLIDGN